MARIEEIKNAIGNGARANRYRVFLGNKVGDGDLLCKSATFPGVTIGQVEVWNQGRKFILPGDTSYTTTWTVSFYGTEDHQLRKQFIDWMRRIDNFQENKKTPIPANEMVEMKIIQMTADDTEGQQYLFHNVFVQDIGEISVADDSADAIQEFDVTFSFTDWIAL